MRREKINTWKKAVTRALGLVLLRKTEMRLALRFMKETPLLFQRHVTVLLAPRYMEETPFRRSARMLPEG